MTVWLEGKRSFFLGTQAFLLDDEHETAATWAASHITHNPAYKYTLGRFVEADRANQNRQLFSLDGLQIARPTIEHAPMNMNHSQRRVVGAFVAAELMYPTDAASDDDEEARDFNQQQRKDAAKTGDAMPDGSFPIKNEGDLHNAIKLAGNAKNPGAARAHIRKRAKALGLTNLIPESWGSGEKAAVLNPYIEALGVFWRHYFPEEFELVEAAHAEGRLFYSMECVPSNIQCVGDGGCNETYEYAGRTSPTYCDHLNKSLSDKFLINPHFTAGAIIVPPLNPGWKSADVHSLVSQHAQLAERIYDGVKDEMPHLNAAQWEAAMGELLMLASP